MNAVAYACRYGPLWFQERCGVAENARHWAVLARVEPSTRLPRALNHSRRMTIRDGIIEAIGHTPLIKLQRASEATGCTILAKAEFMNPGGSVKNRAGRQMILKTQARVELR